MPPPSLAARRARRPALGRGAPLAAAALASGLAGVSYAVWETRAFVLRTARVPVLPAGQRSLRVLHLSDLHLTPGQRIKADFVRGLTDLGPDLVVVTGDFLAHHDAVGPVLDCLDELLDAPGAFVLGSNDYFAPIIKNPARYLLPSGQNRRQVGAVLPWRDLVAALAGRGWADLDNSRARIDVGGRVVAMAGVDDPHLHYDDLAVADEPPDPSVDIAIAIAHAPYLRVLDRFTASGWPLVLAGHTHGGQLRIPGKGALVTNCDLDTDRCRGLHQHHAGGRTAWMNVSAGLGTSPYAPVRFACRPEATLLTLESPPTGSDDPRV
ncbi:MAG: metallophosphoesterase [Nocardioidaceae bacterium]|nr:metallophosphoesterase [Nocardioidaceae bacterium]